MNIHDSFGFQGQFELIQNDVIGYVAGNTICKWNIENNKKEYIQSNRYGFQAFCSNYKRKMLVTAEYGMDPLVHVYTPDNEFDLRNVSRLEIIQMDISHDGRFLLVVVGVPKYEICVWDLTLKQRVKGTQSSLPLKLNFQEARFMLLGQKILIKYEKQLLLYGMVPQFENENGEIVKNVKLELIGTYNLDHPTKMIQDYCFIVDPRTTSETNNIYLIQGKNIIYIDGENLNEIARHECAEIVHHIIVTQVHIIVIYDNSKFEWLFKYIQQNLNDESMIPFKLDKKYQYPEKLSIIQAAYNQSYTKLLVSLSDASLIVLPIPAESQTQEEEGQPDAQEEDKQVDIALDVEVQKFGPYQKGSIQFIKEFKGNYVIITGCDSGKVVFWDVIQKIPLTNFLVPGKITAGDLKDNELVIGTSLGVMRFYDVGDIRNPVLYKIIKIFTDKPITNICINEDQIAVSSAESQQVFLFFGDNLIGFVELPFPCQAIAWNTTNRSQGLLLAISSFVLIGIQTIKNNQQTLKLDLVLTGRKIDPDQNLLIINNNGEAITTGKDKVFRKYKFPEETLNKMDLKVKVANQAPLDEQDGHQLPANCLAVKDFLYSGAKDGTIMIRSADKLIQDVRNFKAHNIKSGGVSAICVSNRLKVVYTGGYDGELFWWTQEKIKVESDSAALMKNNFGAQPAIQDQKDQDVMFYQQQLELEYLQKQAPIREAQKQQTKSVLKNIQHRLKDLLEENLRADELERLDRDEFVIDLIARDDIIEEGKRQQMALRDQVRKENIRQEILYNLIKERTWDQMEVPLKGINGLLAHLLVWNFHIRIRTTEEQRKLKIIKELRKQELKEIRLRKQQNMKEIWSIEEQIQDPKYILNAKPGQPQLILTDYEKKEDPAPSSLVKQAAKPGVAQPASKQPVNARQAKQRQMEEEKKREEEEEKQKQLIAQQQAQQQQQQKQNEEKKGDEDFTEWEYLYGASELFTNNRKRNQMILLQDVILSIKKQFNIEFEQHMRLRQQQLDNINERNKRIVEINLELKKEAQLVQLLTNKFENPEKILNVDQQEIPFSQYETREMREKKEQERLKEEARLRALMADDSGIRAVKDMMGGTLEEKKDTPLDEKLEMEDWMKKNPEDMNEDERMKLKEFEFKKAKLEEEKEKLRKNLEAELKKLNIEISDICTRFDDKLLVLFRRKLEYEYRVLEQELYIVRLALSIINNESGGQNIQQLEKQNIEMSQRLSVLEQMKQQLDQMKQDEIQAKIKTQDQLTNFFSTEGRGPIRFPQKLDASKMKILWQQAFQDARSNEKDKIDADKKLLQIPKYKDILIPQDLLFELRKKEVHSILDEQFETYLPEVSSKASSMQGIDFDHDRDAILQILQQRFKIKQEFERQEKSCADLEQFSKVFDNQVGQLQSQIELTAEQQSIFKAMVEENKSNIELVIRFKQGLVEISQDKPVPGLLDAILIPRKDIDEQNEKIREQGDKKLKLMNDIKTIKYELALSEYELKSNELVIRDLECKTREVQLLKVKKEMQIALTKDDTRLNEKELKNIEKQTEILKKTTEKRQSILLKKKEKLEKDIEFIKKENQQLLKQGSDLNENVKQLQEISDMQNKKGPKQGEETQDLGTEDKFMQIAKNHKLFHEAKKHAEEIELLRDELSKLKARTFANFANAHR